MTTLQIVLWTLEIQEERVDLDVAKSAYRKLMHVWHPDKHQTKDTIKTATRKSQEIIRAYELLTKYIQKHGPFRIKIKGKKANSSSRTESRQGRKKEPKPGFPDKTVLEVFFKSSHIVSAGYNEKSKKLYIKFKDNVVYEYTNVGNKVWEEFKTAKSHGRFANSNIYYSFKYRRCTEAEL